MSKEIIINHNPMETRVAVLDNSVVTELYHEREKERGVVGNIYKGKVRTVLYSSSSSITRRFTSGDNRSRSTRKVTFRSL